jgi:ribose transport system permease protein
MNFKKLFKEYNREFLLVIAMVMMTVIFASINPLYVSVGNLTDILDQTTIYGLMGLGMTFIIISGAIDLSVGAALAFTGVIVANMAVKNIHPLICVAAGITMGFLIGMINGFVVVKMKVQSFVATLGSMSVLRGFAYVITGGFPIIKIPNEYRRLVDGIVFGGLRSSVLIFFFFTIICWILLKETKFGNYVYAIGGNEESARLSGVNVDWYRILIFGVGMVGTALATLIQLGKLGVGEASAGQGFELNAIAAVAIGGTSMVGGRGSILGTVLGAMIFSGLRIGLIVVGVEPFWQFVATGLVIIIAAYGEQIQTSISRTNQARIQKKVERKQAEEQV